MTKTNIDLTNNGLPGVYVEAKSTPNQLDAMAEKKVEVDDESEFKLNLRHLLDKHAQ